MSRILLLSQLVSWLVFNLTSFDGLGIASWRSAGLFMKQKISTQLALHLDAGDSYVGRNTSILGREFTSFSTLAQLSEQLTLSYRWPSVGTRGMACLVLQKLLSWKIYYQPTSFMNCQFLTHRKQFNNVKRRHLTTAIKSIIIVRIRRLYKNVITIYYVLIKRVTISSIL
jgi:hypothetical protein